MPKPVGMYRKPFPENVANIVKDVLKAAEYAESVKVSISIEKNSTPTISYSIDNFPLVVFENGGNN